MLVREVSDLGCRSRRQSWKTVSGQKHVLARRRLRFDVLEYRTLLNAGGWSTPDDPLLDHQYHHDSVESPAAWEAFQPDWGGEGIVIAILDRGIDYTHPELDEHIWVNLGEQPEIHPVTGIPHAPVDINEDGFISIWDLDQDANNGLVVDADQDGSIEVGDLLEDFRWADGDDELGDANDLIDDLFGWDTRADDNNVMDGDGHGSGVAGVAAAETNNATGIAGVAGDALIMPLQFFHDGDDPYVEEMVEAMGYAREMDAHIASLSYEIPTSANFRDMLDALYHDGTLFVMADNARRDEEGSYRQALYIGGTDVDDIKADYDAFAGSDWGSAIDVSAPADDIFATALGDEYDTVGGTSFAAPMVSGTAALIWAEGGYERSPLSRDKVVARLLGTADPIDHLNTDFRASGQFGLDGMMGTGRINANRAVNETLGIAA